MRALLLSVGLVATCSSLSFAQQCLHAGPRSLPNRPRVDARR